MRRAASFDGALRDEDEAEIRRWKRVVPAHVARKAVRPNRMHREDEGRQCVEHARKRQSDLRIPGGLLNEWCRQQPADEENIRPQGNEQRKDSECQGNHCEKAAASHVPSHEHAGRGDGEEYQRRTDVDSRASGRERGRVVRDRDLAEMSADAQALTSGGRCRSRGRASDAANAAHKAPCTDGSQRSPTNSGARPAFAYASRPHVRHSGTSVDRAGR